MGASVTTLLIVVIVLLCVPVRQRGRVLAYAVLLGGFAYVIVNLGPTIVALVVLGGAEVFRFLRGNGSFVAVAAIFLLLNIYVIYQVVSRRGVAARLGSPNDRKGYKQAVVCIVVSSALAIVTLVSFWMWKIGPAVLAGVVGFGLFVHGLTCVPNSLFADEQKT